MKKEERLRREGMAYALRVAKKKELKHWKVTWKQEES